MFLAEGRSGGRPWGGRRAGDRERSLVSALHQVFHLDWLLWLIQTLHVACLLPCLRNLFGIPNHRQGGVAFGCGSRSRSSRAPFLNPGTFALTTRNIPRYSLDLSFSITNALLQEIRYPTNHAGFFRIFFRKNPASPFHFPSRGHPGMSACAAKPGLIPG